MQAQVVVQAVGQVSEDLVVSGPAGCAGRCGVAAGDYYGIQGGSVGLC